VAAAETGDRDLPVTRLARAAALAGLRFALLDLDGSEVTGMSSAGARDAGQRRLPPHLDTIHTDEVARGWVERRSRPQPWFTFALDRMARDQARARDGTPDDHQIPQDGDSPQQRADARRREHRRRRDQERERRFLAGEFRHLPEFFECCCPPRCDELENWSGRPVHAEDCPCSCDVG